MRLCSFGKLVARLLSVVADEKYYNNQRLKLLVTLFIIILISVVFTVAEGVLEFVKSHDLPCEGFKFFTHGGMIFLFTTSAVFALAYFATFLLYMLGFHRRWNLPSKKSFYRYALFLSLVNVVQAIGSMLWYTGKGRPASGQAGIWYARDNSSAWEKIRKESLYRGFYILIMITNIIYVATFAPVVYWIFLSNYFRMNKALKQEAAVAKQINVTTNDSSSQTKHQTSMRVTNPVQVRRKSYFEDQTALIAASLDSSASSYGSLNDEEMFTRIRTEPDK